MFCTTKKTFYFINDKGLIEYKPLTQETKIITTGKVGNIYKIIRIGDIVLIDTSTGLINTAGEKIETLTISNAYYYDVLLHNEQYALLYKMIQPTIDNNGKFALSRKANLSLIVISLSDFSIIHKIDNNPLPGLYKLYSETANTEEYYKYLGKVESSNKQFIIDHYKIVDYDEKTKVCHFQLDGEIIKVFPIVKKECCVCGEKPKPRGLILPCTCKDFCYNCVKDVKICPKCLLETTGVIKL